MNKAAIMGAFLFALASGPAAAQEKIAIGGSGAVGDAVELLGKAYKEKYPADTLDVISEAMANTGGLGGVKSGRLTIGVLSRPISNQEGLVYRTITRQAVAIGVHKSLGVSNLSDAQVCDVFSGKIKSWKELGGSDTKVMVLSRKPEDVNMKIFREKMSCFKTLQLTSDAVLLTRGSELLDSLNNRPGTVGIANVAASMLERANVRPLAVAGAPATLEAVKSGKYKYYGETGFVTAGEPKGAVKRFIDFATGPEAEKIWQKFGMAVAH